MRKVIILLLMTLFILLGCSQSSVQSNSDINNDANVKTTIEGINVTFTSEIYAEKDGQTTYYVEISLTNSTKEDIMLPISGFGARVESTYFGYDETLTEFTVGEYVILAGETLLIPVYYTIPSGMEIEEVLLYDENATQYIFE